MLFSKIYTQNEALAVTACTWKPEARNQGNGSTSTKKPREVVSVFTFFLKAVGRRQQEAEVPGLRVGSAGGVKVATLATVKTFRASVPTTFSGRRARSFSSVQSLSRV